MSNTYRLFEVFPNGEYYDIGKELTIPALTYNGADYITNKTAIITAVFEAYSFDNKYLHMFICVHPVGNKEDVNITYDDGTGHRPVWFLKKKAMIDNAV